jgi:hypothetical protein
MSINRGLNKINLQFIPMRFGYPDNLKPMVDEAMKNRLAEVLDGANLTQLAEDMGVSTQAVFKWKTEGKIKKENAVALAQRMGYSSEWLITGLGKKKAGKEPDVALNVTRLRDIMDAIHHHEKLKRIELSSLTKAKWINEIYCDLALKTKTDIMRRTAEIVDLFAYR